MALLTKFIPLHGQGIVHRTTAEAGWAKVINGDETLFYLASYGSADRESISKPSQVTHLDRAGAVETLNALRQVFPGIEDDSP